MARQRKFIATGQTAAVVTGAALRFLQRTLASLAVWMMPIAVVAVMAWALTGHWSSHQGSGLVPNEERIARDGEQPMVVVNLHYSGDYIKVVKMARARGGDILGSFKALESAWNAASPSMPLALELVGSAHPGAAANQDAIPVLRSAVMIDENNFAELSPLLDDVRSLILEGDGSGCGRLRRSGYQARPAAKLVNLTATSRDIQAGSINHAVVGGVPHSRAEF